MKNNYFIKLFKTPKAFYLYDALNNKILNIDKKTYISLEAGEAISNELELLLPKHNFSTVKHPDSDKINYIVSNKISRVTLQLTQNCNLRCAYCPYSSQGEEKAYINRQHNKKTMSLEVAKKSIDLLVKHSRNSDELLISFYGGEPVLEFNLIEKIVEYSKEKLEGKTIKYAITTNGTLLTQKILDYFVLNNFFVTLSLDGPKEINDNNRISLNKKSTSYDKVIEAITYIRNNKPEFLGNFIVNTVIDPENDFSKIIDFFDKSEEMKNIEINATAISGLYRTTALKVNEKYVVDYNYEKLKVMLSKIGSFPKNLISPLVEKGMNSSNENVMNVINMESDLESLNIYPESICAPGLTRFFIDVNGNFFVCEKASEESEAVKMGNIETGVNYKQIKKMLNFANLTEESCKKCWGVRFCSGCVLGADDLIELSAEKRLSNCDKYLQAIESNFKDLLLQYDMLEQS